MELDFTNNAVRIFSLVTMLMFFAMSYSVVVSDLRSRKIPNRVLGMYLKLGGAALAALLVYGLYKGDRFVLNYAAVAALNTCVAAVVGYVLWYFDLWSPGDGKYFPVVALLLPLQFYQQQFVPFFPSLLVLVNAYLIALASLFGYTVFLIFRDFARGVAGKVYTAGYARAALASWAAKARDVKMLLVMTAMLFYMLSLIIVIRSFYDFVFSRVKTVSPNFSVLMVLVILFLASRLMSLVRGNKVVFAMSYVLFGAAVAAKYFSLGEGFGPWFVGMIRDSFFIIVVIPVARKLMDVYHNSADVMPVGEIRMGVVLPEETVRMFMERKGIEVPAGVPITDEQSQSIKDNFPSTLKVGRAAHVTFGPFIFAGAVFTMVFYHTIMHFL